MGHQVCVNREARETVELRVAFCRIEAASTSGADGSQRAVRIQQRVKSSGILLHRSPRPCLRYLQIPIKVQGLELVIVVLLD